MPDTAQRAVIVRGNVDRVDLAEWLVRELDQSTSSRASSPQAISAASHEYRLPGMSDGLTHVFYTHVQSLQELQQIVNSIRSATHLNRIMPVTAKNAIVLRGADNQIAAAEQLVRELDSPNSPKTTP